MRKLYDHDPARPWRGVKRDGWEGGHRTPFFISWPGNVPAGSVSDQPISQTDLMATFAEIIDYELPKDAAEDSFNMLPVLLGEQGEEPLRPFLFQQTISHSLSIRIGDWKYMDHQGSGGSKYDKGGAWGMEEYFMADTDPDAPGQLYNLKTDPAETTNLYSQYPEVVERLKAKLEKISTADRSAP